MKKYLEPLGITALNEMQIKCMEQWGSSNDLILLSPTGSGKTVGFLLPLIKELKDNISQVQVLIIVPSRELGIQIESVFRKMQTGFKVNLCYGGHSTLIERNNLSHPPAVLIGTPGRLGYHIRKGSFSMDHIQTIILDEFDKSLEMGFHDEMEFIIRSIPGLKKRVFTSATDLPDLPEFTGVSGPLTLNFLPETRVKNQNLELFLFRTKAAEKTEELVRLISVIGKEPTIVFCNHREAVDRISVLLNEDKIHHEVFHGGLEQQEREKALIKLRNGSVLILLTTDLASRGLDIPEVRNVVHYQLPITEDAYIHRNGRTARMHASGSVFLMISDEDRLPGYIPGDIKEYKLSSSAKPLPKPKFTTIYFGAGKKDKVNKTDILGFLLKSMGLKNTDVGKIEVLDNSAFAAVSSSEIKQLIPKLKDQKIKGRKIKIQVSY